MKKRTIVPLLLLPVLFLLQIEAEAAIRAQWGQTQGREITLELQISEAVPALVIVRLEHPAGLRIEGISPRPKKRNESRNGLKLLFTGFKEGSNTVTLTADRLIKSRAITGSVMYKNPATGAMEKIAVQW